MSAYAPRMPDSGMLCQYSQAVCEDGWLEGECDEEVRGRCGGVIKRLDHQWQESARPANTATKGDGDGD